MGMGRPRASQLQAFWFPSEPVKGQAADWGLVGQDFSLACPLWVDLPNMLMLTAGVRNRLIDTDAILPDSHKPYPSELWNAQVGLMYMRQLSGDRMIGGGVSLGSASDHPFASIDEMNVSMNAMYRIPSGEHNAWMFMVMYSPTSEIQFPIPGVSYSYNPSDRFHANIGLPFMVSYKPTDRWSFDGLVHADPHDPRAGDLQDCRAGQRLRRLRLVERGLHAARSSGGEGPVLPLRPPRVVRLNVP